MAQLLEEHKNQGMFTGIPDGDEQKVMLIQKHFFYLLHAHKCQKRDGVCHLPLCPAFKVTLDHMKKCRDGEECKVADCHASYEMLKYYQKFEKTECPLCEKLKPYYTEEPQTPSIFEVLLPMKAKDTAEAGSSSGGEEESHSNEDHHTTDCESVRRQPDLSTEEELLRRNRQIKAVAWKMQESLGDKATKGVMLFANVHLQHLKANHPCWDKRESAIARIWSSLKETVRNEYEMFARENRRLIIKVCTIEDLPYTELEYCNLGSLQGHLSDNVVERKRMLFSRRIKMMLDEYERQSVPCLEYSRDNTDDQEASTAVDVDEKRSWYCELPDEDDDHCLIAIDDIEDVDSEDEKATVSDHMRNMVNDDDDDDDDDISDYEDIQSYYTGAVEEENWVLVG